MKKALTASKAKPITFTLTAAHKKRLMGKKKSGHVVVRFKWVRGKLLMTHHRPLRGSWKPANAAFA